MIGALYDLEIHQMDVKTVFLNDDVDTELYIQQLQEYDNQNDELVCKLHKELYDIKQAMHLWNHKINKYFLDNGFKHCEANNCIYVQHYNNGNIVFIGIWVDDIIIIVSKNRLDRVKETLC